MKNFQIGKEIVAILSGNDAVKWYVDDKIFPLVATNTQFPFIVYRRSYYTPTNNKDYEGEKVGIEILICSTKYDESVNIANAVADALQHNSTDIIEDIVVTNIQELYQEDTFTQTINVEVTLTD